MTIAEILVSGEYTGAIGIAVIVFSLFLFARLLEDGQAGDERYSSASGAVDVPPDAAPNAAVIAAIGAAVAEYRGTEA